MYELSIPERQALLSQSLAAFFETPTPSRRSDVTKALGEYVEAWIVAAAEDESLLSDGDPRISDLLRAVARTREPGDEGTSARIMATRLLRDMAGVADLTARAAETA